MPFECPQEVADDLEKLLENNEDYDVIIYTGENENVKGIRAHSNILRIRSQNFCAELSKDYLEKKDGKFIFRKPNIPTRLFEIILRFIYCGKIDLEKLQETEILKLLLIANELNIPTLINHIQEYLVKHQDEFFQKNPVGVLETVYQKENFSDILNLFLKKVCEEPEILFNSDKFISLKQSLLELLLKRDDLSLDEIVIWDNLIKWCFAQNSSISQDPTQWNNDEVTIMERTIHKFVSLIRFYHISMESFVTKVYPFKVILPENLINDMLLFYAKNDQPNEDKRPPRQSKCIVDSVIINQNHIAIFANWIYRKVNISEYIHYNFHLLYRASRDGNTSKAFHEKCDNKGATLVVIKITDSDQIVGGYNPLSWDCSNTRKPTYDSFIFSFTNKNNLHSAKISYSNGVRAVGQYLVEVVI
ncbi:hypothetical protein RclHR1_00050005 [Rhizophagus clarus]|uniref:BTB domain-containing protein n=1 Tax=Rhizophagus clarus TaxID=94130 RepID=A0A2Z6SD92_9GLOM|nr:hypothetical protein RclHR1_00050005 [Rhizophagus clarus]GES85053.1 hypothetical protein GLOIN_2v1474795 [Rhizophagus clarus]